MIYFISQEWKTTKGNHAGMSHLCRLIKDCYQNEVRVINVPAFDIKFTRPAYHLYYFDGIYDANKKSETDSIYSKVVL